MSARTPWITATVAVSAIALVLFSAPWFVTRDPLDPLAGAVADGRHRLIEARLTAFEHRQRPVVIRSLEQTIDADRLRIGSKAVEVLKSLGESQRATDLHAAGIALLLAGDSRNAVEKLTAATQRAPEEPRYWNDLAAARYSLAGAGEVNLQELLRALVAADHALRIDASMADASFNRALILQAMGLRTHAVAAWKRCLEVDPESAWSVEARSWLHDLETSTRAEDRQSAVTSLETLDPARDGAALRDLVTRFPEEARRRGEATFLAAWAKAELAYDDEAAHQHLARVRTIGTVLREQRKEPLLAETVERIDACTSRDCRVRIAEACRKYDDARRLIGERRLTDALPAIRSAAAALRDAKVPLAFVADYYIAGVLEDSGDVSASAATERLKEMVPANYVALRAQVAWQQATAHARAGHALEAIDAHHEAVALFEQLGEVQNATRMRSDAAAACSLLGRDAEAWRLRAQVFDALADLGDVRALQNSLTTAARFEAVAGRWPAAVSLLNLASDRSLLVNQRLHIEALMWRALALQKLGHVEQARNDIREARTLADKISDPTLRAVAQDDVTFAEASLLRAKDPRAAAAMLDTYLENSGRRGRNFFRAEAHLERGRSARALKDDAGAEQHFRWALRVVDERRSSSTTDADVYFQTEAMAAEELTDLLVQQNRVAEAWQVVETTRAASFGRSVDVTTLARRLPPDALVLEYVALEEQLVIFSVDRKDGLRIHRVAVRRDALEGRVRELVSAIREGSDADADRIGHQLYAWLLAPVERVDNARQLIIVADRVVEGVPFAMLRRNDQSARVLERAAITLTPSAALTAALSQSKSALPATALLVGDPAFDTARFPDLPRLSGAAREVRNLDSIYTQRRLLTGADASPSRVAAALQQSGIVHLATHAIVNESDPMRSMFVLASEAGESGALYSRDIARMDLSGTRVVVLAGCRTASTAEAASHAGSLALAFLHGGAPAVVGALWPIEDHAAHDFSRRLHGHLARGSDPVDAAREAQLELMRNARSFRMWAAYVVNTL